MNVKDKLGHILPRWTENYILDFLRVVYLLGLIEDLTYSRLLR